MIKYELKKLCSNKIVIIMLIISVIAAVASAIHSYNLYGSYYVYNKSLLQKGVIDRVNVNDSNVKEYEGKTDIKSEYLYEQYTYVKYCTTVDYFRSLGFTGLNSLDELPPKESSEARRDITRTENGINYDRSFGWQNLLSSGQMTVLPFIAIILIIVSSAVVFSSEYQNSTDVLLMCTLNKRKIVRVKILSSLIFTAIYFCAFQLIVLCSYGIMFSLDGIGADSGQVIFDRVQPMGKAYLIMLGTTLFADLVISLLALAVSSFCKNTITTAGITLGITMIPVACATFPTISHNFDAVMRAMPATILLSDFNISNYLELTKGKYIVGGQNTLLLFALISVILIFVSVLTINISWKYHKVSN